MNARYRKPTLEQAEAILSEASGAQVRSSDLVVPRLLIDDLIRTVAIIALSDIPRPPKMLHGNVVLRAGYSAGLHKSIVKRCREVMDKHNLHEWNATTKEGDAVSERQNEKGQR